MATHYENDLAAVLFQAEQAGLQLNFLGQRADGLWQAQFRVKTTLMHGPVTQSTSTWGALASALDKALKEFPPTSAAAAPSDIF